MQYLPYIKNILQSIMLFWLLILPCIKETLVPMIGKKVFSPLDHQRCYNLERKIAYLYHKTDMISKLDVDTVSGIQSCRKSARVTQSQFVPSTSFSLPIGHWLAEAAWRDILGLSYALVFPQLGVMLNVTSTYSCI